jgi:restriction system protein
MEIMPKFNEIMYPILDWIKEGLEYNVKEISDKIRDKYFDLSEEQKNEIVSNGYTRFHDRLMWARTYLSKAGLILNTRRGFIKISDDGIKLLESKINKKEITLEDLAKYNDFLDFKNIKKEGRNNSKISEISSDTPLDKIDFGFNEIEKSLKDELLKKLKESNPYYFEKIILILFKKMGYGDFEETPKSGDGGIDGIISQDKLGLDRIYTQAKRYIQNSVGEKEIRNFIGAMSGDVRKGIFVTTSVFDKSAIKKAYDDHNHKIILINGIKLVELMIFYDIGVQVKTVYKIKEVDEDFFVE